MPAKRLGEVAQYINGRAFKPDEWEDIGRPIIRIQNLTNSTDVCNRTTKLFEEKYLVKDGDLLFAWSASLGAHIWHGEEGWLVDNLFSKEQQAKEGAEVVVDKIDNMKKSILARAFRGELGTNDPAEESAVELLKYAFN